MKTFFWGFVFALFLVGILGINEAEDEEQINENYDDEETVCFFEKSTGVYEYEYVNGCIDINWEYDFDELEVEISNDVKYYSIFTERSYDLDTGYIQLYYFNFNSSNGYRELQYYVYNSPIYKEDKEYVCTYLKGNYNGNCAATVRNIMDEYSHNVLLFEDRAEFPNNE